MSAATAYLSLVAFAVFIMIVFFFRHQIDRLIKYLEGKDSREERAE